MIRVLQVIGGMNAGGMETMLMNYYRNINNNEIQFDFLISAKKKCFYEDEINALGGRIYRVTARRKNILKNRKEIRDFFRNNKYDIVEFHQGITYFYPLKVAKKSGVKVRIIHNHGIDRKFLKKFKIYNELYAKKRINGLATNFFSCSKEVNEQLFTKKTLKRNKVNIINNAIDIEKYKYNEESRKKIRQELNIDEKTKVYGHIGTFTYPKNHNFLIDTFEQLLAIEKNSCLILVGEGPLKNEIKKRIQEKKLEDKVIFLERRNDINKILSAIDIFLFPSVFEGIPLTLIEAQANGLPIIMSNNISNEVLINSNCYKVSLEDTRKWIDKILSIKLESQEERINKNYMMQQSKYNIKQEAIKLANIYLNLAKD